MDLHMSIPVLFYLVVHFFIYFIDLLYGLTGAILSVAGNRGLTSGFIFLYV